MSTQQQHIANTYDWMDELFRAALATEFPDITGALYNGDFSLTLEDAQTRKHDYILEGINFAPGMRILDIGSGWGPMLQAIRERGGEAFGITLSPAQAAHCKRHDLDVVLADWKDLDTADLGSFDGVVSVGAFEHFCTLDEYLAGQQDKVYRRYFAFVDQVLPKGGRQFLQTMTWGNPHPRIEDISLKEPEDSAEYVCAHLRNFYDFSAWLPDGVDHIVNNAHEFSLVSANSGRLDYIQTLNEWGARTGGWSPRLAWLKLKLTPRLLKRGFRSQIASVKYRAQTKAFEQNVFEHTRMILEKK
jgi:cyclopropane-fatty-acyl-phospholipid synthase